MPSETDPIPLHCSSCGRFEQPEEPVTFEVAENDSSLIEDADDDDWLLHLEDADVTDDDRLENIQLHMYCPECHESHPATETS